MSDWPQLENALKYFTVPTPPPLPTTHSLGVWINTNQDRVTSTLALHTPLQRITYRSKPWWLTTLSAIRKGYNSTLRTSKKDRHDASLRLSAIAAGSSYF